MRAKSDKEQQTMSLETTKRLDVTTPLSLLEHLIPKEQAVVEATQKELRQMQLQTALSESAGTWSDEDYPDLMSVEDVNQYVRQLREASMARSWDEIAGEV